MRRRHMVLRLRTWMAPVAALAVTSVVLSTAGVAFGAPRVFTKPTAPSQVPAAHGIKPLATHFAKRPAPPPSFVATKTAWPHAASASLTLDTLASGAVHGPRVPATGSPVWASAIHAGAGSVSPHALHVTMLDHAAAVAAGVPGVLFTVTADHTGPAQVGIDYSGFAHAYGGNYGSRLGLVSYPVCLLTTPTVPACHVATALRATNTPATSSVSATIIAPATTAAKTAAATTGSTSTTASAIAVKSAAATPMVLAATASTPAENGGSGGTLAATSLSTSGSWSASNTGDFGYQYPITLPSGPSTQSPTVALSYDSGATDAENATAQPQSSWVGEGWNTPHSFIEQSFQNCSESPEGSAAPTTTYDQCYDGPIYTLSVSGSSKALIWDAGQKVFKTEDADGSIIKHFCTLPSGASSFTDPTCVAGTSNASGTKFNDWWQVTGRDGSTDSFGMNHLPGWASGKTATNSIASEPVYSAQSGDPCYSSSGFSASVCTTPYRWGLDYATDIHGNAMAYYYHEDTNYYGAYNGATMRQYVRDQYLDHIDYGFTTGNAYGTIPDKVIFHTSGRCATGSTCTTSNTPDVPSDQICSGTGCTAQAPAFFSTVKLASIETQQYSTASSGYTTIDNYALTQSTPATGDGTSATLWLSQVQRTGSALAAGPAGAKAIAMPLVTFTPTAQMASRVDPATYGLPAFTKYRLATITTETGSQITAAYGLPYPCSASAKPTESANTSSCYPVSWTPPGYTAQITDWFNKYALTSVQQTDPTGGASQQTSSYAYPGGAAWHYDDNELVKAKYRTYGQFRGYGDVITYLGDGTTDAKTKSETTYYRGMSKNNNTTVVNVKDSQGGVHEDVNQLAGEPLERSAYLGSNVDHSTITSYWVSAAAATRARTGLPALTANVVAPVETYTRQALTSTGTTTWRYTETDTSYDATTTDTNFGLPLRTYTHTSPANTAYDICSTVTYAAANTSKNLVGLPAESETDSVACGGYTASTPPSAPGSVNTLTAPTAVSRPDQVVSASRTFYDDTTYSTTFPQAAAPSLGNVTMTRKAGDYTAGAFTWQTTLRAKYDSLGRQTDVYDGNGNHSGTTYTANTVGLTTSISYSNALNRTSSSTFDTQRDLVLTSTDTNGVVNTKQYDALGRVTAAWIASRATSTPANALYTYAISNSGPTAVTTQTLNNESGYRTSTAIYDGLFRIRQTQTETPRGGRLINDTFYDTRGWVTKTYSNTNDTASTPNTTVANTTQLGVPVPMQDVYTHNSLGQVVIDQNENNGTEVSRITTVYNGDRTTVVPPAGGTVSTTIVDPLGRTSEVDNYIGRPTLNSPPNPFTGTFTITGGSTRIVSYGYDHHGNLTSTVQGTADSGGPTWTSTYNLLGQLTATNDPDAGQSNGRVYDGGGNLIQSTDARGKTISYTYDALNRKTAAFDSTVAGQQTGPTGNQIGAWVYDNANNVSGVTHANGHLTTATTYIAGNSYTEQQIDFNAFGESAGVTLTVPASEGALAGTYTVRHLYTPTIGLPSSDAYLAAGGLPNEQVKYGYRSQFDLPDSVGGLTGYTQTTSYDALGRVNQLTIGPSATVYSTINNTYDPNTGQLTDRRTDHTANSTTSTIDEQKYSYDLAGNITGHTSTRNNNTATTETQCYSRDGLDQLTAAWTANDQCATAPTAGNSSMVADNLGASAAYWTSWNIDTLGDRSSQTQHAFTGGPATDTTTTYGYGKTGGLQPHTLTSTSTTGGSTGSTSYGYDTAGNMTSRNAGQGNQTIGYDDAGDLTSVTGSTGGNASYEYDAGGDLLIQKDPGTNTLYFAGQQFALNTTTNTVTGTRYYTLPDGSQVIRTGSTTTAFTYAIADPHGTPSLYFDNTATTVTWRQYTPYGAPRGATVTAPDNHGFLDQPMDTTTGLTADGARQYDPTTGRFVSDDPILELGDPTQLNGYGYAGNNPVDFSDPTGTRLDPDAKGSNCNCSETPDTGSGSDTGRRGTGGSPSGGSVDSPAPRAAKSNNAVKTFFSTWGSDAWGALKSTADIIVPGSACVLSGHLECHDQGESFIHMIDFFNAGADCLGGDCGAINRDMDCQDGWTAKCSANVSFLLLTVVAGKFAPGSAAADTADADAIAGDAVAGDAAAGADSSIKAPSSDPEAPGPNLQSAADSSGADASASGAGGSSDTAGPAGGGATNGSGAAAKGGRPRTNYMDSNDKFAVNHAKSKPLDGYHDVVAHGTPDIAEVRGVSVSHRVFADLLRQDPSYPGGPIRLCSCKTGALDNGFAQNLANQLGVPVRAPIDTLWAWPSGRMGVGPTPLAARLSGGWRIFRPGNR